MDTSKNVVTKYYFWEGEQRKPQNTCSNKIENFRLRRLFEWEILRHYLVIQSSITPE